MGIMIIGIQLLHSVFVSKGKTYVSDFNLMLIDASLEKKWPEILDFQVLSLF